MNRRSFIQSMAGVAVAVFGLPVAVKGECQKKFGAIDAWFDGDTIFSDNQEITNKCVSENIRLVTNPCFPYLNIRVRNEFPAGKKLVVKIKCSRTPYFDQNTKTVFESEQIKTETLSPGMWIFRGRIKVSVDGSYIGLEYVLID